MFARLYVRVDILLTRGKHLHASIISLSDELVDPHRLSVVQLYQEINPWIYILSLRSEVWANKNLIKQRDIYCFSIYFLLSLAKCYSTSTLLLLTVHGTRQAFPQFHIRILREFVFPYGSHIFAFLMFFPLIVILYCPLSTTQCHFE